MKPRFSPPPVPAGVSPEIAGCWIAYFHAFAMSARRGASEDAVERATEQMDVAAGRLASAPDRSLQDIAAKAQLVLFAQCEDGSMSHVENDLRTAVLSAVVSVVRGEHKPIGPAVAPRGVNQPPRAVYG